MRSSRLADPAAHAERIGLATRGEGSPSVVVGDQVGAELGHPSSRSHALVLTTTEHELVEHGRVRWVGPDLDEALPSRRLPLAQVVVAGCGPGGPPDPFALQSTQFLANRLPGYMTRAVPGRLWIRVGKEEIRAGFDLCSLGRALVAAFCMDFPELEAVEVLLASEPEKTIDLDSIAAEAKVMSGKHKKLVLVESGLYECPELDCEGCPERSVCDALKDISVRYRSGEPTYSRR